MGRSFTNVFDQGFRNTRIMQGGSRQVRRIYIRLCVICIVFVNMCILFSYFPKNIRILEVYIFFSAYTHVFFSLMRIFAYTYVFLRLRQNMRILESCPLPSIYIHIFFLFRKLATLIMLCRICLIQLR